MNHRMIYLTVTFSLIVFFPPRLASQDTKNTNPTKEALAGKVKAPSYKNARPAAQHSYPAPAESSRAPNINETETRVREAEAAEKFLQLKDQVNADLIQLEDGKNAELIQDTPHSPKSAFHVDGKTKASNGNHVRESRAQIMGEAAPASMKSAVVSSNR